nr:hypothetical protein [uncultured Pseudoxanthomonas sp.]
MKTLDAYLTAAGEMHGEVELAHPTWMSLLRQTDALWREELFVPAPKIGPVAYLLMVQAYYFWLAGVRTTLSGHATAAFPQLRTGLESACYAYLVVAQPELATVWMERDSDEARAKLFRKHFTQAPSTVAKQLASAGNLGALINDVYNAAITFGGHPNPRALFEHLRVAEQADAFELSFSAIDNVNAATTIRALVAAVEHGYLSLVVCANAFGGHPRAASLQARVDALCEAKDAAVEAYTQRGLVC